MESDIMNKIIESPLTGVPLTATSNPNIYVDEVYNKQYILGSSMQPIEIKSPANGSTLIPQEDGTFYDQYNGTTFSFDSTRSAFIPHYIPDDSMEPARIDIDRIIGIESGRSFSIDRKGRILTPEEITNQRIQAQDLMRIKKMEEDGTIAKYLDKVKQKRQTVMDELASKENIKEYFSSLLDSQDHPLNHLNELLNDVSSIDLKTLKILLDCFNRFGVEIEQHHLRGFDDPIIAARLNDRYKELTGNNHPRFIQEISEVIDRYTSYKEEISSKFSIYDDDFFAQLEQIKNEFYQTTSQYEQVDYISRLREEHQRLGIDMPDEYYEMEEVRKKVSDGVISPSELQFLCDKAFGKGTAESRSIYRQMILTNRVEVNDEDYAKLLHEQIDMIYGNEPEKAAKIFNQIWEVRIANQKESTDSDIAPYIIPTTLPTIEQIAETTQISDLETMREDIMIQTPYLEYRSKLREMYLQDKSSDELLVSEFAVDDKSHDICTHTLTRISASGQEIVKQATFPYNEGFQQGMLLPSTIDYAQCSVGIKDSTIVDSDIATYQAMSNNNNILGVKNVNIEIAQSVGSAIHQNEGISYQQKENLIMQTNQQMGFQKVLTMDGFSSTMMLFLLAGLFCGIFLVFGAYLTGLL